MGKAKQSKVSKKQAQAIYYDTPNYVEIAATIIEQLKQAFESEELMGEALMGGEVSITDFAVVLENLFDTEAIQELINTPFGRGVLFGMYLRIKSESLVQDEQEVLDEMDV